MRRPTPCSERRRRCPTQFSWVDQRLARERYFEGASTAAWTLYLFLITVSDPDGVSFYAERSMCVRLRLTPAQLGRARAELIELDLIAFEAPVYQVLSLGEAAPPSPPTTPSQAHQRLAAVV